jgi:hypothetical protein
MNEDIVVPVAFFTMVVVLGLGIPLIRAYIRRKDREALPSSLSPELARRLDRIEGMVETISVEVERITEGQRFTTRLLSEGATIPVATRAPAATPARSHESGVTHA